MKQITLIKDLNHARMHCGDDKGSICPSATEKRDGDISFPNLNQPT